MPEFRLNPTITQPCPKCGAELTFYVKLGDQAVECPDCKVKVGVKLPSAFKDVERACSEFEAKVNEKIRLTE